MEKETRTSGHSRGPQAAKAQVDHEITHQVGVTPCNDSMSARAGEGHCQSFIRKKKLFLSADKKKTKALGSFMAGH